MLKVESSTLKIKRPRAKDFISTETRKTGRYFCRGFSQIYANKNGEGFLTEGGKKYRGEKI